MSDDNIAKMYVTFTCVDCNQKFATRKELEEHERKLKISQVYRQRFIH